MILAVGMLILLPYAMVEEISIRGYIFRAASRSWGTKGAVVGSAIIFALIHGWNDHVREYPLAMVGLVLAGIYLASAYLITGNLWLAIFLHTGWNLMEGPIFGLPVSGNSIPASVLRMDTVGPDLWTGGKFGPEAGLLLCLLMGVHIVALWAMRPLFAGRPEESPTPEGANPTVYRAVPVE
jgi:membrane protease YdiL (CAAX protease family)